MPAENSMANQDMRENSGRSSSRPRRTRPILENAAQKAKIRQHVTTRMYHQPTVVPIQSRISVKVSVAFSPYTAPIQVATAKATRMITTAGMKTARFTFG